MNARILLFIFCLFAASCKDKDKTPVPAELAMPAFTEIGRNVIAYRLDGKVIKYSGVETMMRSGGVEFAIHTFSGKHALRIHGTDGKWPGNDLEIEVYEQAPVPGKEYVFLAPGNNHHAQYYTGGVAYKDSTYATREGSGKVKFTRFDTSVVSGVFSFTAFRPDDKKVEITEGFFDIAVVNR
jgi:hypothetical protein